MLNLNHLKYFHDACRTRSLAESARLNRVSVSAVSQAIRALERALETELLRHARKSFQLAPAGDVLFARCEEVFASIARIHDAVRASERTHSGPLSIASSHSIGLALLPEFLKRFGLDYPAIHPSFRAGNAASVRELLRSRAVDLAIAVDDGGFGEFERTPLSQGKFVLASRGKQTRYIVGDAGAEVSRLREAYRRKHGEPLPILMEVQSWELIASLAEAGAGIGLLPEFMLKRGPATQLRALPGRFELGGYEICAFHRGTIPRNAALFLEELRAHLSNRAR